MPDFLDDVTPGQPIGPEMTARRVNAWNRAARLAMRGRDAGAGEPGADGAGAALVVHVRNDTGADLPVRSVLALGDPLLTLPADSLQIQDLPAFAGDAPASADDLVVVLLEPVAADAVGRAVLAGVAVVDVDVSDATHTHAAPAAGQTTMLDSADSGPTQIIARESGTGTKRAVVLLGGGASSGGTVKGKLDGALAFGGSATLSIWAWNGSAEADTGDNVTVYDWLLSSGQTIATGTQVVAAWDARSGRYYVTGAQCP